MAATTTAGAAIASPGPKNGCFTDSQTPTSFMLRLTLTLALGFSFSFQGTRPGAHWGPDSMANHTKELETKARPRGGFLAASQRSTASSVNPVVNSENTMAPGGSLALQVSHLYADPNEAIQTAAA